MEILIKASQLILSLSILVVLHEFGHFIPARIFKTRVEKFYLFFNPWFSLYKKKIGDTEWGIGWLPLGGYVKIAGMIDESMDKEQMNKPAEDWEFRSKKAWQRLIIMFGGIFVNIITGIVIYILVVFTWGQPKTDLNKISNGMAIHPYFEKFGVVSGDKIIELDGEPIDHYMDITSGIMLRGKRNLKVLKADGKTINVTLPETIDHDIFTHGAFPVADLRREGLVISGFTTPEDSTRLTKEGMRLKDSIIAINGHAIKYYDELSSAKYKSKDKSISLTAVRGVDTVNYTASMITDENGNKMLGFISNNKLMDSNSLYVQSYSFGSSFSEGLSLGYWTLHDYVAQFKFLFTKKGASSIGGFASIGNLFSPTWDWNSFWMRTAWISIALAFMNFLPIPALDGGHIVFLLYEMITGREAPQKILEYAQIVGIVLLLGLMIYANGNDIYRFFFK